MISFDKKKLIGFILKYGFVWISYWSKFWLNLFDFDPIWADFDFKLIEVDLKLQL